MSPINIDGLRGLLLLLLHLGRLSSTSSRFRGKVPEELFHEICWSRRLRVVLRSRHLCSKCRRYNRYTWRHCTLRYRSRGPAIVVRSKHRPCILHRHSGKCLVRHIACMMRRHILLLLMMMLVLLLILILSSGGIMKGIRRLLLCERIIVRGHA